MTRLRTTLLWSLCGLLAAFYLYVGWLTLHPRVSDEYRLYYIEQWLKYLPNNELTTGYGSLDVGFGETVDFSRPVPFLSRHWSALRPWGVWSRGAEGGLVLRLEDGDYERVEIELQVRLALFEQHPRQRIEARVGDTRVASWDQRLGQAATVLRLTVPRELIGEDRLLRLDFAFPDAVDTRAVGVSENRRLIALGLERLTIRALSPPA